MQQRPRRLQFEESRLPGMVRLFSGAVTLAQGQRRSTETLTRVVKFDDPYYGVVELSPKKLQSMVDNFNARVYGQDIAIDVAHATSGGAAGYVRALSLEADRLRGDIEWTPFGLEAVGQRGFRYFSVDFHENYVDPETGAKHGPTLFGAALTIRPRVKHLDPIDPARLALSFDGAEPGPAVSPHARILLSQEITTMWKTLLEALRRQLAESKLHATVIDALLLSAEAAVKPFTDEAQAQAMLATFATMGKQLAEQVGDKPAVINLQVPSGGVQLSEADIVRLLDKRAEDATRLAQQQAQQLGALGTQFAGALEAWDGWKALSEPQRARLLEAKDLITAGMTAEQVTALAQHQIRLGNDLSVAQQLAQRGFGASGTPRITMDESNSVKQLQETVDRRLGILDRSDADRFRFTGGALQAANKAFAERVLAQFDAERGAQLSAEHKMLAGGDGIVSDVALPVIWERTVIREALYNLVGLQFVDVGTMTFATSGMLPYSYRDPTAAGRNSARKYEGQSINRAGVIQTADTVYPLPQKLAFEVSDELRYLTSARQIDWEAVAENQRNASRIIGEDTEQLIFNEVLAAADEYGAVAVTSENLEPQADGTNRVFVLAQFPVVRPRKVYDLKGNQVGSTVNPITVTYNSVVLAEYDGTGTQPAGSYYVLNYNLGEIYKVSQAGAIETPADTVAYTISYSYATNRYAFSTDPGSVAIDAFWDTFLYRYGLRKTVIEDDRYHMANFGLMSGTVMTQVEQAKQFGANSKRNGTDLQADGNLGRVKDVPNFKTSAPGLWMGDQRVVVGERGITRLRMMRPWQMGDLENQKDSNGRFTGKKEAYGDQFLVLHTPTPLKRAYTSMVLYSAAARVARVNP